MVDGVCGYQEAADPYDVAYHRMYGWVHKPKAGVPEALVDHLAKAKEVS